MYIIVFAPFLLVLHTSLAQTDVTTASGEIHGLISEYIVDDSSFEVVEYRGIPYAAPPTGENRFKPPGAVQPWPEPLDATKYGAVCPQSSELEWIVTSSDTTYEEFATGDIRIDEDCLFLNIYRRSRDETMDNSTSQGTDATMVFFHGGDFTSGSGMAYAGNILASNHDVIVVTVNYRLGALGFLSDGSESLPGNYGILDQQMALQWIRSNSQAFGGDPNAITIFGSGAGGSSVHLHTIIEDSKSLFARAIVQSATYNDAIWTRETAKGQYDTLLGNLGNGSVKDLHDLPWKDIHAALQGPWQPVISDLIPEQPKEAMTNPANIEGIDLLIGSNDFDAYHIVNNDVDFESDDWYHDAVRDITNMTSEFNDWTDEDVHHRMISFNLFYMGLGRDIETLPEGFQTSSIVQMYTDQLFGTWAHEVAMAHVSVCSCNVYKYVFSRRPPDGQVLGDLLLGAVHGQELPYVFGFLTNNGDAANGRDKQLSYDIMAMWTEFAKSGFLDQSDTSNWQTFDASSSGSSCRATLLLDVPGSTAARNGPAQKDDLATSRNWEFWKHYYETIGVSCLEESRDGGTDTPEDQDGGTDTLEDQDDECEAGVWSASGVEMSNDTAGALLITFIVLTGVLLIAFMWSCHSYNKAKRKIRKIIKDDGSSVISNSSTRM